MKHIFEKITVLLLLMIGVLPCCKGTNRICTAFKTGPDVNLTCAFDDPNATCPKSPHILWYYNDEVLGSSTKSNLTKEIKLENNEFLIFPLRSSGISMDGTLVIKDYHATLLGHNSISSEMMTTCTLNPRENPINITNILEDNGPDTSSGVSSPSTPEEELTNLTKTTTGITPTSVTSPSTPEEEMTNSTKTTSSGTQTSGITPTCSDTPPTGNCVSAWLAAIGFFFGGGIFVGVIALCIYRYCIINKKNDQPANSQTINYQSGSSPTVDIKSVNGRKVKNPPVDDPTVDDPPSGQPANDMDDDNNQDLEEVPLSP